MALFAPIFEALAEADCRFVVVGGSQADVVQIGGLEVRVASIHHLVEMKQRVGRPKDLEDVSRLREVLRLREGSGGG